MKKNGMRFAISVLLALLLLPGCVYHKPAFRGKVVDADTDEPLEGAVVAAIYYRKIFTYCCCVFPHSSVEEMDSRESLTNRNGMFHIPSYMTVMMPISSERRTRFIIFKPGYKSGYRIGPAPLPRGGVEKLFSGDSGVVRLSKVKTWKERRDALPSIPLKGGILLRQTHDKEIEWLYRNKGWRR